MSVGVRRFSQLLRCILYTIIVVSAFIFLAYEREEIVELASDDDDSPSKTKLIENEGRDERVSSTVRSTSVSTGSKTSDKDAQENGEIEDSEGEEDEEDEDDESEDESDEESSSGESYSEDSEEFERYIFKSLYFFFEF